MGFLSFNEKYYAARLDELEGCALSADRLYEAKQLLKVLCDLADEGYTALSDDLECKFHGVTRLRAVIERGGAQPFATPKTRRAEYGGSETELSDLLSRLTSEPPLDVPAENEELLEDIADFGEWLDGDGAHIFLLRDCLLPYVYLKAKGRSELWAYPIGRAFLSDASGEANFDDIVRLPIYCIAEEGVRDFAEFKQYFKDETQKTLKKYPRVRDALARLLDGIPAQKITAVESGYCGTVPMLLSAIDDRVDFKMYTTAPFFFDLYKDRIFCRRYERLRSFETLYSQDALFAYSALREGKFFVRTATDDDVFVKARAEAAYMIRRANRINAGLTAQK